MLFNCKELVVRAGVKKGLGGLHLFVTRENSNMKTLFTQKDDCFELKQWFFKCAQVETLVFLSRLEINLVIKGQLKQARPNVEHLE